MATLKDIANLANVSPMTVSRFLNSPEKVNEKTKQKIRLAMSELDYQPNQVARSLITKKTNIIGVIIPDIRNPFFSHCFHAIEVFAEKNGFSIFLCNSEEDAEKELKYIKILLARRVDGIILMPVLKKNVIFLQKNKINFVLVDRKFEDLETDFITADHYYGAYNAVEYLIHLGHRKIGLIKGPDNLFPHYQRFRGYKEALEHNGIELKKEFIKEVSLIEPNAYESTKELLTSNSQPTALFGCNNMMSVGALRAIQELKMQIPKDISFISFDEIPSSSILYPKITYISQPIEFIGTNAAMILIEKINKSGYRNTQRVVLKPEIIYGDSCLKIDKPSHILDL